MGEGSVLWEKPPFGSLGGIRYRDLPRLCVPLGRLGGEDGLDHGGELFVGCSPAWAGLGCWTGVPTLPFLTMVAGQAQK